jgi:hypothetical protein
VSISVKKFMILTQFWPGGHDVNRGDEKSGLLNMKSLSTDDRTCWQNLLIRFYLCFTALLILYANTKSGLTIFIRRLILILNFHQRQNLIRNCRIYIMRGWIYYLWLDYVSMLIYNMYYWLLYSIIIKKYGGFETFKLQWQRLKLKSYQFWLDNY